MVSDIVLFPPDTLALFEAQNLASLPDSCTVELPEGPDDGEGGGYMKWIPIGDPVPCRVSPIGTPVERIQSGLPQQFARNAVVFAKATQIPIGARLTIEMTGGTLRLSPEGSNGPRSYEAQRKYECGLWKGRPDEDAPEEEESEEEGS